jgi:hypothetical protein
MGMFSVGRAQQKKKNQKIWNTNELPAAPAADLFSS